MPRPELTAVAPAEIPGAHRTDERPPPRWWLAVVVLLGLLAVGAGILLTVQTGEVEDKADALPVAEAQRDAAAGQAQDLGRQVIAACAEGEILQSPDGRNLCESAARVQAEPIPGTQGIPGEPGPPPTAEALRAAVAAYMAENPPPAGEPGRPPNAAEVAAAVAQHLTANPPAPGRPPTAEEIANAVATYFATNPPPPGPPGEDGEDGRDGEPGRGPTAEEIQAAVDAYLEENPPPPGEEGPQGPAGPTCADGTSLQTVQFADGQFGLGCVLDEQPVEQQPTTTPEPTDDVEGEPPP